MDMTLADITSLEELMGILYKEKYIPEEVIQMLWFLFGTLKRDVPHLQRRGAIVLLGMLIHRDPAIVDAGKIELLLRVSTGPPGQADPLLAKYACVALQHLSSLPSFKGASNQLIQRFPNNHVIFARVLDLIQHPYPVQAWLPVAEQAINTIYELAAHPDLLCETLIQKLTGSLFRIHGTPSEFVEQHMERDGDDLPAEEVLHQPVMATAEELARLLYVVGHVAIKQLAFIELIEKDWKRWNADKKSHANDPSVEENRRKSAVEEAARRRKSTRKSQATQETDEGDELDKVAGTVEDEFSDRISYIREYEMIYGQTSLLALYGPLIVKVCRNTRLYSDTSLQIAATLALSKFMCVSNEFCNSHLHVFFTILERNRDPIVRSNLVIALGDLAIVANSLIGENIGQLYRRLGDAEVSVRKNALMVLTHLILNGMVKVKGHLGEMAKCMEDEEPRIRNLAKLFFTEFACKDNAVYNNLTDILGHLSGDAAGVDRDAFRRIMSFLFDFVKQERQTQSMVERLCNRFAQTDQFKHWQDVAYCLSLLSYSERNVRVLVEHLHLYQDKLHDEEVYESFKEIVAKSKTGNIKTAAEKRVEHRALIEGFEVQIQELHEKGTDRERATVRAGKLSPEDIDGVAAALSEMAIAGTDGSSKPSKKSPKRMNW